ncbi:DUF5685 family protein [Fervidobacterium riparium]|uniref:Uncharacterized protein n=1 Tax=Fervidobacterium gondwanense DSM 13020 TaxID=1121883 RepID=A0A1M7T8N0_FERGO|nr:DUF5685 family protein [Fervidobacterium gondwanense]UXF01339.1 hypothetical protein IB67_07265 [Fervidobacterium riparium]SHN67027.1 hypothetical protein SAMN02745226_01710 [Fervidobacterium gondwanense DSM 13020]
MFGYVKPLRYELKLRELDEFRGFYCGVCTSMQKMKYISKFFLTYDAVFLALVISGLKAKRYGYNKKFCIETLKRVKYFSGDDIDFAATRFLKLLEYKLIDDYEDDKNFVKLLLAKSIHRADDSNDFEHQLVGLLKELRDFEKNKVGNVERASDVFGRILQLLVSDIDGIDEMNMIVLKNMAYNLGKWIYVLDAFDDIKKDAKKNNYNPILLEHGFNSGDSIDAFVDRVRPNIRKTLYRILDDTVLSYNLLEIKSYKSITDNIVYQGLFNETERILMGNNRTCPKKV